MRSDYELSGRASVGEAALRAVVLTCMRNSRANRREETTMKYVLVEYDEC